VVVENGNFDFFAGYFFGFFRDKASVIVYDTQSVVGFSVIPKCVTVNDLNGYFVLNSVFTPVWLSQTAQHLKNNCVKTNNDRHILLAAVQIFGRDSIFWQYKVCADIRWGSLERRR